MSQIDNFCAKKNDDEKNQISFLEKAPNPFVYNETAPLPKSKEIVNPVQGIKAQQHITIY